MNVYSFNRIMLRNLLLTISLILGFDPQTIDICCGPLRDPLKEKLEAEERYHKAAIEKIFVCPVVEPPRKSILVQPFAAHNGFDHRFKLKLSILTDSVFPAPSTRRL